MGLFSKLLGKNGRRPQLEKLQNELCQDLARIQSGAGLMEMFMEDLEEVSNNPNSQEAKELRGRAAKLEYIDLCIQDPQIVNIVKRYGLSVEGLWNITKVLSSEELGGKSKNCWMHLDVISNPTALAYYCDCKQKKVSDEEIAHALFEYYKQ